MRGWYSAVANVTSDVTNAGAAKANWSVVWRSLFRRIAVSVSKRRQRAYVRDRQKWLDKTRMGRYNTAEWMKAHAYHFIANDGLVNRDRRQLAWVICTWKCGGRVHSFGFVTHDYGDIRRRGHMVRHAWK